MLKDADASRSTRPRTPPPTRTSSSACWWADDIGHKHRCWTAAADVGVDQAMVFTSTKRDADALT
jgi:hypothetical protein